MYNVAILLKEAYISCTSILFLHQHLQAFTQSSVIVDATRGGSFVLFGGNVVGKFTDLVSFENGKFCCEYQTFSFLCV